MTENNNTSFGFATAEEEALFSGMYDSSEQNTAAHPVLPTSDTAPVQPTAAPIEMNTVVGDTDVPIEVLKAMEEEKAEKEGEWLPKMTVRVNGRVVHGKKKNRAIIFMGVLLLIFVALFIFAFCASA